MLAKLTLLLLATGLLSIGLVCAQSGNPFKGRTVGDFGERPKASVHIVDDGPVKGDFRSAPDIVLPAKGSSKPEPVKVPTAPVSAREAAHRTKLRSTLSPKLIKNLDKNAYVGDFEHTSKGKAKKVWGKPMTAKPMTLEQVTPPRGPSTVRGRKL